MRNFAHERRLKLFELLHNHEIATYDLATAWTTDDREDARHALRQIERALDTLTVTRMERLLYRGEVRYQYYARARRLDVVGQVGRNLKFAQDLYNDLGYRVYRTPEEEAFVQDYRALLFDRVHDDFNAGRAQLLRRESDLLDEMRATLRARVKASMK